MLTFEFCLIEQNSENILLGVLNSHQNFVLWGGTSWNFLYFIWNIEFCLEFENISRILQNSRQASRIQMIDGTVTGLLDTKFPAWFEIVCVVQSFVRVFEFSAEFCLVGGSSYKSLYS